MSLKTSRFYGILAGIATIGYYLVFYAIDPRLFFHLGVQWSSLFFFLAGMVIAGWKERQKAMDAYPWQAALRSVFTVYVVAAGLYHVFYFLFFNFGDAGLAQIQQEVVLENLEKFKDQLGQRNAATIQREIESTPASLTLGASLLALARSLMGGFIISLLLAFALRKE